MTDEVMDQPIDSESVITNDVDDEHVSLDEGGDGDDGDMPAAAEPEEEIEFDVGERKLSLPKSVAEQLKSERMMHRDYTQKTQEVATERNQLKTEREQYQRHQQEAQKYLDDVADVRAIDKQLKAYNDVDLSQFVESDPAGVMRIQEQRRALEAQRALLVENITKKQNENALAEQQSFAKQVQDAEAYLIREIKGINKERVAAMEKYATAKGMDAKEYARTIISNPVVATFVHKAELYDALMAKQAPKPQAKVEAQPSLKVGSAATVKKDPTQMTDAEFKAYRIKVSKRNK